MLPDALNAPPPTYSRPLPIYHSFFCEKDGQFSFSVAIDAGLCHSFSRDRKPYRTVN
jgi:hypothetical protein